jgi:trk system potassium uptake protein TrkA
MRAIVLGCGRVGSRIANMLDAAGNQVAVIDRDPETFSNLRPSFAGETITGFGYDRHVLESGRINRADAFIAATTGDNLNIVAALIAKRRFRVPIVVARIYDPDRAHIYLRQGIRTVSPVEWSAHRIGNILLHSELETEQEWGNGEVVQIRVIVPAGLAGKTVQDVSIVGEIVVATIVHAGVARLPTLGMRFERGDVVRFVVAREAIRRLESFLENRP